jgi:hypothetical protein
MARGFTNSLLGAFSHLRTLRTCAVVSGRPPVHLSTYIRAVPPGRMCLEFYTGDFYENLLIKSKFG